MSDSYRYRCGECGHRTAWKSESQGEHAIDGHYARRHPRIVPGGMVEYRRGASGGSGWLIVLGIAVLLLIITSRH